MPDSQNHTPSHDSAAEHYRHLARHLHKAVQAGSAAAGARVVRHLPRLRGAAPTDVLAGDVGLQECQHVVARENGYGQWVEAVAPDAPRLEDITTFSDADIQVLLDAVDLEDLALLLLSLTEGVISKRHHAVLGMLHQLPRALQDDVRARCATLEPDPVRIAEAQRRVTLQARGLRQAGQVKRPAAAPQSAPPPALPPGLEVWQQPLENLPEAQIRAGLQALATAHAEGILEAVLPQRRDSFVWQGVCLIVDGTHAALVQHMLDQRARTALRHVELRWRMAIEATSSIAQGDNPRLIQAKLAGLFSADADIAWREVEGTLPLALERLQRTPATCMSLQEIAELYTDLAWLAQVSSAVHADGLAVLAEVAVAVDDGTMARGLVWLAEVGPGLRHAEDAGALLDGMVEELEADFQPCLAQVRLRYDLVRAGLGAIAEGCAPDEMSAIVAAVHGGPEAPMGRG